MGVLRIIGYVIGGIIILVTNKFMWELFSIFLLIGIGLIPKRKRR